MKNIQLKLYIAFLMVFSCTLFFSINKTFAIYKEVKGTTISMSVIDPSSMHTVRLEKNDGTGTVITFTKNHNETIGNDLITPTRTNYNFMGWYDSNGQRIYADEQITGDVTFHAEWAKIVCKKVTSVNNLHTEDCDGSQGCITSGVGYTSSDTIRYGSLMDGNIPVAGDAFDCDVYYDSVNNTDTFDETDQYGKHIERFYFVREKVNNGSENTAVLIYYTSFDGNGRVDTQHTNKGDIDSKHYSVAETWLPTSSLWDNPNLIDFDPNNGQITRFLSTSDLEAVCGALTNSSTPANANYFATCLNNMSENGTVNHKNWFIFENTRFQSSDRARAGMWLETDGTYYYRIQTSTLSINRYDTGDTSDNIARPVIEVPISSLEGYINATRYTITFNTHDGVPSVSSVRKYEGDMIGTITTVTREHHTFDGWYATYSNGVYSDPVDSTTVVHGNMNLHAKWVENPTCTVTLELNGGTGLTTPEIVDIGDYYVPGTPTKANSTFVGWYTDFATTIPYDSTVPISTSTLTLYAKWTSANYVAEVEGVGQYETLADAISHVPTGTTSKTRVTLLQNITLSEVITIPSNKWVELNGGNYTISGELPKVIINNGKLDIISGTITTPSMTTTSILISNESSNSVLNVSGGTLYNPSSNGTIEFITISNVSGGTVNITGGTLITYGQSASINNKIGTLNVSGGQIIAHNVSKGQAIYMESGTVNISGNAYLENVSGTGDSRGCVDNNGSGTLRITGGTIVSKGFSGVTARKNTATIIIGSNDGTIDITTPVIRGQRYGLEKTSSGASATVEVYDGIFESYSQSQAISSTSVTKPTDTDFKTDGTISIDGVTYHTAYLIESDITVSFYPENGDSTIVKTISNGSTIGSDMPIDPIKANYYFDGWYDGNTEITSQTVVISPINAYARWVQSITNATISSTLSVERTSSETIGISGNDIEARTFASSDTTVATVDANGVVTGVSEGTATITITGSKSGDTRTVTVTVTPLMHDINFYKHDGGAIFDTKTVTDGGTVGANMPNNPTEINYVFDGWVFTAGNSLTPFTSATQVYGDIDVIATWKEKVTYATLSTSPSPFEIVKGNTGQITLSATDQDGVVEARTYTSSDTTIATVDTNGVVTAVDVGTTTITITGSQSNATRTVTVIVTLNTSDITFYTDTDKQVVWDTVTVENGYSIDNTQNLSMPNNPTKTNYIFDGWVVDDGNNLTAFTSATVVNDDIDVIPSWTPSIQLATIPATLNVVIGNDKTISVTGPSGMESYTFSSADSTIATVNSTTGVVHGVDYGTVNITITGSRSNTTRTVEVTVGDITHEVYFYDDDEETVLYPSVSVSDGGTVGANMPNNPTKSGYVFDGWIVNDGNSLTPFTSTTEVYGDVDAIAVWKEPITSATVASTMTIRLGNSELITLTPTGTRAVENYTISSSNSNIVEVNNHTINGTDIGSVTITITGSLSGATRTITVNVTNGYSVVFKDDEDNVLSTISVADGDSIDDTEGAVLPNNLTKSGYTFDDWYIYDGTDVTTTRLDTTAAVTSDLVYKPRWAGANDVAAIGTTYYTTYKAAIDAVDTNDVQTEVRLLKDVAATGFANNRGVIDRGKNVLLNGNGHELSCSGGNAIWNCGTLTIKNIRVTCGTSKTAPIDNGSSLTVIDSTITMTLSGGDGRAAIYNGSYSKDGVTTYGTVTIMGNSNLSTEASARSTVQNTASGNSITIYGGTISQLSASSTKYAVEIYSGSTGMITGGTITAANNHAVSNTNGTLTITGGSIIAQAGTGVYNTGTLTVGTINNAYDTTNPVIQGETYGINSTVNYSLYDGTIKGKTGSKAVNDFNKITGTESGFERATGTEGAYYTLYYEQPINSSYTINFEGRGGTVSDASIDYNLNEQITANDLATATRGVYTFDGWYTDSNCSTPFTAFTPTQAGSTTLYANWSYASSTTPVSHILTSDAMTYYFANVSSWASTDSQIANNQDQSLDNDDHTAYLSTMLTTFNNYSCSECEIKTSRDNMNSCDTPSTGTYCDQPKGYDTGIEDDLDVYLYVNNAKSGSKLNGGDPGEYIISDDGVIYNMIPGVTYYWESQNDSSIYGVVSVTKDGTNYRRTLKSSVRNLRDLGGMSVSYTENNTTVNGTIKYGKLYRGAQNAYGSTGINELKALGITREVDLRGTGDGNGSQTKFPAANYDVSISDNLYTRFNNQNSYQTDLYKDVKITNYYINPVANTYFQAPHEDNYKNLKQAMKAIMRQIANHEVVYFHCTIGTDRTGTIAYFLEGLLGVSNEDRLRDYEMTYFYGLTNRSRFHNSLSTSSINPRFYAMYKSYPDVSNIEDFYFNYFPESDDESVLADFRAEMIQR